MNPYPNNPYSNPVLKSKEQKQKEDIINAQINLETPILEWLKTYLEKEIYHCDSIDSLKLDLNNPENTTRQIASLKMLKSQLLRIKLEVERRLKKKED